MFVHKDIHLSLLVNYFPFAIECSNWQKWQTRIYLTMRGRKNINEPNESNRICTKFEKNAS